MKRILYIIVFLSILPSCSHYSSKNSEIRTYKDAEDEFVASLDASDTTSMLALTDEFMNLVKNDKVEDAVGMIAVLYNGVLYKPAPEYVEELVNRYRSMHIQSFELDKFYFSTEGINDVCYITKQKIADLESMIMKITFNPVKIDDSWYLTLKDGNISSKFLPKERQIHDLAPAPEKVRLNTKPAEN